MPLLSACTPAQLDELAHWFSVRSFVLPVILQLEDLHWADSESRDFLNCLSEVDRDVPLLVLSLTRPTLFERRTD